MGKLFGVVQSNVKRVVRIVTQEGENAFYALMMDNSIHVYNIDSKKLLTTIYPPPSA